MGYLDRSMSVPDNQVSIGEYSVTVDLSYFANQGFVLIAEEKGEVWGEKDPFDGRHKVESQKVKQAFAQAQAIVDQMTAPPPPPTLKEKRDAASLSRAEFKLGLLDMGELDAVKQFIAQTNDQRIIIMWEDSGSFRRTHPDLLRLAGEMGYTDEQLDALFGVAND